MPTTPARDPRTAIRNSIAQNTQAVQQWNDRHVIGTLVEVILEDRSVKEAKTTSAAWLMGGHTAVVKLEGIAGGYALGHIRALATH